MTLYSHSLYSSPLVVNDLPLDILPIILEELNSKQTYLACTLVNKVFNRVATPLLYRELDSRAIPEVPSHHPASTLLQRPEYAKYVRHITETGSVHRSLPSSSVSDILQGISLCTNLTSLSWNDDSLIRDDNLRNVISVIQDHNLPLRELTIRTHSDIGMDGWAQIHQLTGLRSISLWCMDGPPPVLQGWSEALSETLTHLELGRCTGVPPTILINVLSHLPLLKSLRLKGAPATSIPTIISSLPNLKILDTEYLPSFRPAKFPPSIKMPQLTSLTIRANTLNRFDTLSANKLRTWCKGLLPKPGLEKFKFYAYMLSSTRYISAFATNGSASGTTMVSGGFITDLAKVHGESLREFDVDDIELTMDDVKSLRSNFCRLEVLVCAVVVPDVAAIKTMVSGALNLHTLKLQVHWVFPETRESRIIQSLQVTNVNIRTTTCDGTMTSQVTAKELECKEICHPQRTFRLEDAISMMIGPDTPKLRMIGIGREQYLGKWILVEGKDGKGVLKLEVLVDTTGELKWNT